MDKTFNIISAYICTVCGFLFGASDGLMKALIAFMAIDYITGVTAAVITKNLSSETGFTGIAKKVFILCLVAVGHIIDTYIIGENSLCRSAVIGFYIANEGISILENSAKLGIPLPKKLIEIFQQLKKQ
ncbi:MAG TPA: holin [Ruminococcus sp.]|nr:holin [Ruminococcus sp.]